MPLINQTRHQPDVDAGRAALDIVSAFRDFHQVAERETAVTEARLRLMDRRAAVVGVHR